MVHSYLGDNLFFKVLIRKIKTATKLFSMHRDLGIPYVLKVTLLHLVPIYLRSVLPKHIYIRPKAYPYPIAIRPFTSDLLVLRQLFEGAEYDWIESIKDRETISTIIDCGSNIGIASCIMLHRFPKARVIAIEPDKSNLEVSKINLLKFKDRLEIVQAGVWSKNCHLALKKTGRLFSEWSIQVEETEGPSDCLGRDLRSLMRQANFENIDILKMDIEGSEYELFKNEPDFWLSRTRNLMIEIHNEECREAVSMAFSNYSYDEMKCGELFVFLNIKPININQGQ